MTLSVLNSAKKKATETESTLAQAADPNEKVEAKQDEAEEKTKGKHGEDFCCGSCS